MLTFGIKAKIIVAIILRFQNDFKPLFFFMKCPLHNFIYLNYFNLTEVI